MFEWTRYQCSECKRVFLLMQLSEKEEKGKFVECKACGARNQLSGEAMSGGKVICRGCGTWILFNQESRSDLLAPRCLHCGNRLLYKLRPKIVKRIKAI